MNIKMNMSSRYIRTTEIHDFICPICKNTIPLPRKKNKRREKGHKKTITCFYCRKEIPMIETY